MNKEYHMGYKPEIYVCRYECIQLCMYLCMYESNVSNWWNNIYSWVKNYFQESLLDLTPTATFDFRIEFLGVLPYFPSYLFRSDIFTKSFCLLEDLMRFSLSWLTGYLAGSDIISNLPQD